MTGTGPKAALHQYLRDGREALLWKLEGLSELDVRRPLTPTGTNLLGLVKHLAGVELLYLGFVFDRHFDAPVPWFRPDLEPGALEPNTDMWATPAEPRDFILDTYRQACQHSDATIETLDLTAVGEVVWWPAEHSRPTLHRVLLHTIVETQRHTGHADIVRELIDGAVGLRKGADFMPSNDPLWWESYRSRLALASGEQVGQPA